MASYMGGEVHVGGEPLLADGRMGAGGGDTWAVGHQGMASYMGGEVVRVGDMHVGGEPLLADGPWAGRTREAESKAAESK